MSNAVHIRHMCRRNRGTPLNAPEHLLPESFAVAGDREPRDHGEDDERSRRHSVQISLDAIAALNANVTSTRNQTPAGTTALPMSTDRDSIDNGRTVVSAVNTRYAVNNPTETFAPGALSHTTAITAPNNAIVSIA